MSTDNLNELNTQHNHWENTFSNNLEMYGEAPSYAAQKTIELFKKEGIIKILELGGGQGRDTIFFAKNGFKVTVLDYTEAGILAINRKAQELGLSQYITAIQHDARNPLLFQEETFDACYSHMLFCMALTVKELEFLSNEVNRILKPGGLNVYTVRNINDSYYGKGIHRGEDMYEMSGFIVHFFSKDKIALLAKNFEVISIYEFEEGQLPRMLYKVTQRKYLADLS